MIIEDENSGYEFTPNPPKPIEEDEYVSKATKEFQLLLETNGNDEKVFQAFFERNPAFVPGAKDEFDILGPSGHNPFYNALISQPRITGIKDREPDFMWLATDSLVFSPILIEIEAPNKKYFNKNETPTAKFKDAKNQLDEWTTLLSIPENIMKFYSDFNISQDLRDKIFEPRFVLIYGRRSEYSDNKWLAQKRVNLLNRNNNQFLMSYDRISPKSINKSFTCSTVKSGIYHAKFFCPTYKLSVFDNYIHKLKNIDQAIDNMAYTTEERKEFLKFKYPKLIEYLKKSEKKSLRFFDFNKQYEE